jgi:hypothetical protein
MRIAVLGAGRISRRRSTMSPIRSLCRWRRSYTRRLCIDAGIPSFCEEPIALSLLAGTGLARRSCASMGTRHPIQE